MPFLDRRSDNVVLRIVYDGPPEAGKTTNVHELANRVALSRRGEVHAPGTQGPRTQYFDWLQVSGGYVIGRRIQCQLVTVPGQPELLRRRRYILQQADAVVLVVDARRASVAQSRALLDDLRKRLERAAGGAAPVGLLVQANKQDLEGALGADALKVALGLPDHIPVIAAQATAGIGVLETFMIAVRQAVDRARVLFTHGDLPTEVVGDATPEELHQALLTAERDVESAIALAADVQPAPELREAPPGEPTTNAAAMPPAGLPTGAPATGAEPATRSDGPGTAGELPQAGPTAAASLAPVAEAPSVAADVPAVAVASAPAGAPPRTHAPPPWRGPLSRLPAGHIWPPLAGRALLAALDEDVESASSLHVETNPVDREISLLGIPGRWEVRSWIADEAPLSDDAAARDIVLAHSRIEVALGALRPARAVVAVPTPGNTLRVWTVIEVPSDAARLDLSVVTSGGPGAAAALRELLIAMARCLEVENAHRVRLELRSSRFARLDGDLRYVGPVHPAHGPRDGRAFARSVLRPVVGAGSPNLREMLDRELAAATLPQPFADAFVELRGLMATEAEPSPVRAQTRPVETTAAVPPPRDESLPRPPDALVPVGLVWPPARGRSVLAAVATHPLERRDKVARWAPPGALELRAGPWLLHTTPQWARTQLDEGRLLLIKTVKLFARITSLLPEGRTFALAPDGTTWRLWQISPVAVTVGQRLGELGDATADVWADAVARALQVLARLRTEVPRDLDFHLSLQQVADRQGDPIYYGPLASGTSANGASLEALLRPEIEALARDAPRERVDRLTRLASSRASEDDVSRVLLRALAG